MVGSIRRECLDHMIVLTERHLGRILSEYVDYYHSCRTHLSLEKDAPEGCVPRSVEKERRPPLRHQSIRSGGNLRVFENLAQTLVAVDAS